MVILSQNGEVSPLALGRGMKKQHLVYILDVHFRDRTRDNGENQAIVQMQYTDPQRINEIE